MTRIQKPITQPSKEDERLLEDIIDNTPESVMIRNRKFTFRDLNGHARHKWTKVVLSSSEDEETISCKCVAIARLNGYFKIKFLYWLVWRWYYYIRQYNEPDLTEALNVIKKKVPVASWFINTTLLTAMKETMMQMTRAEAEAIQAEHIGGKNGNSAKTSRGSLNLSEYSELQ